jgi:hypothetical protein
MAIARLNVTAEQFGYASIDAQSRHIDWSDIRDENEGDAGYEIVLPAITYGIISDHAADLLSPAQQRIADKYPDRAAPRDLAEEFEQSDRAYDEWRDGFEPMMNYVWPAFLPYRMDSSDLADRLAQFAPTITLVYFGADSDVCPEEYGYALSGGGMNLADQIAAAYLCAHQVPPFVLLSGLSGVIGAHMLARIGRPLRAAYKLAASLMRRRAKDMATESAHVFAPRT